MVDLIVAMLSDVVQLLIDRAYIFPEHEIGQKEQHHCDEDDDPKQAGKLCATCHAEILHKILFDAKLGTNHPEVQIFSMDNDGDTGETMMWTGGGTKAWTI